MDEINETSITLKSTNEPPSGLSKSLAHLFTLAFITVQLFAFVRQDGEPCCQSNVPAIVNGMMKRWLRNLCG